MIWWFIFSNSMMNGEASTVRSDAVTGFYLRRIIIPEVIYTALITLVVYRLLLALNHKLEKAEQRSVGSFV